MDANKTIEQAVRAFRAGRGDEGQQLLEKVLKYQPTNDQAVRLLVQIQQQTPRALVSLDTLKRVAEAQPNNPLVHELMANFLIASDPAAAERSVRKALQLNPSSSSTHSLLGETLLAQQRFEESAQSFQMALRLRPTNAFPILRLAEVLRRAGRPDQAVQVLREYAEKNPTSPEAQQALGNLLLQVGRTDEAEAAFRESIRIRGDYAAGHGSLGMLLHQVGRLEDAETAFREGLSAVPDHGLLHVGLAHVLIDLRRPADAEASLRHALELDARNLTAMVSLSVLLGLQGRLTESLGYAQHAANLAPNSPEAHTTLGHAMHALGLAEQATQVLLRGWQLSDSPAAGSNFLHHLNYVTNVPPQDVFNAHRSWAQRYADRTPIFKPHENDRDPDRRLKIGYVSADFREHAVSHFIEPLLIGHDRSQVEVYCYSAGRATDDVTERLKTRPDHWRDISRVSDHHAVEMIRSDGIDILIDLAGHTNHNRLGIFALRAAPLQVTYQGYPNTTGMLAMGYRLTDLHADPEGKTEQFHTEKLLRLPRTAWCYQPPEPAPDVSDLPARRIGRFSFGSFNRLAKIAPPTAELWAKALNAVPDSRLVLKTSGLGEDGTQKYVRELFTRAGLQSDRLMLMGPDVSKQEHLTRYAEVDVALDCFPYHGTTTSCEAMWMGVPSITRIGQTHVSRVGLSLLTSVGLPEFAADSDDQFVEIAVRAAQDLDRLSELRRTLRDRMRASPLMDGPAICRDLEQTFRQVWQQWCSPELAV